MSETNSAPAHTTPEPATAPSAPATAAPSAPAADSRTALHRRLTSGQVSMIGLSGALGTGLFLGSGATIALGGPATVLSYMLAGSIALAVVWTLAEMVCMHPVPGGHGAVAASYLGRGGGYVTRWNFAVMMLIAVGAEVTATATYLQHWFPSLNLGVGTVCCSLFIIGLNLATVRLYGTTEYWFSMIKVTAIVVFILLGLYLIFFGTSSTPATGFSNLWSHGGFAPNGVMGVVLAACMAIFSFGGIENVSVGAAECENPQRDIPRAASTMIWRLLLFYVLAMVVVVSLQPWTKAAASHGTVAESPFVSVLDAVGISAAADVMNAILIVAALSAANGCLYSSSRMIHSLALDRMAPSWAARTSVNGAPRYAVGIASVGMALASVLALASPDKAFFYLYGCATVGILVSWVTTMLTHLRFRAKRAPHNLPTPPARLLGAPYVDYLVIAAAFIVFGFLYKLLPVVWYAGIPYIAILIGSYFVVNKVARLPEPRDLLAEELAGR